MWLYVSLCVASVALLYTGRRKFYPKPYPGIPYNKHSADRFTGDIPDLIPAIEKSNEYSTSIFSITTQRLGVPIAQMLFPAIRKPLIILEDPREIEDILLRRNKEFDRAPMAINTFKPLFADATNSQYNTPKLRAQKRLWADVFRVEFIRRVAAPSIYKTTLELVALWRLKASDVPFKVLSDFQNATLDAMWVALVGEEPGVTKYEIAKTRSLIAGDGIHETLTPPRGLFLKKEVDYIADVISRNSQSPIPGLLQKIATYLPRHRQFRNTVNSEITVVMKEAVERFQRLELGRLELEEEDTCMMDLVLRRQVFEARKTKEPMKDPTKDQTMIDETFFMLVAGYDTTANALTWFARFMDSNPAVQSSLRAELQAAFPGSITPSMDELLEAHLPYLEAVCEEVFRLGGVAKGNLRSAVADTEILGCKIPKGAEIFMNFHINHTPYPCDESLRTATSQAAGARFGAGFEGNAGRDLDVFEPRRWLVRDEQTGKEVFNANALPSLAFGGGYRGCSGRKLAVMEFQIFVALLVLNFEFLPLPEDKQTLKCSERIFRLPDMPYARLRAL
ncbi:cytochrome P450 [Thozetella sp. PMI_491]|nr:cytochrome P450 [Thozetella sp. PMI_491]